MSHPTSAHLPLRSAVDAVLRALDAAETAGAGTAAAATFALRRAGAEVERVSAPRLAGPLHRVLAGLEEYGESALPAEPTRATVLGRALVRAGAACEQASAYQEAYALFAAASRALPESPEAALHAARAARCSGDLVGATRWYRRARELDRGGRIARLARIGEAMVTQGSEWKLSREIRGAVRSGDAEAAGVGLEARALVRCQTARCESAIRDLCLCALRYPELEDRARAAQRVAELLTEAHDLASAREALLLVQEIGTPAQSAHAEAALHRLSAALGDAVGVKRWGGDGAAPPAVEPGPPNVSTLRAGALPDIREWREAVIRRGSTSA